jgi:hypothetical protein
MFAIRVHSNLPYFFLSRSVITEWRTCGRENLLGMDLPKICSFCLGIILRNATWPSRANVMWFRYDDDTE